MNASSLLMVIRSRTFGMLCSLTLSAVNKAAAITGSAEFFAPLIATVPRSAFPPLIRNLSIPPFSLCRGRALARRIFLFPHRLPQIPSLFLQSFLSVRSPNPQFQHHQGNPQIVSRRPQSMFRRGHTLPARLHQNPQRPLRKLLIRQHHVDHQVFIHMPQPRHHRRTQHVQHHLLRRPRLQPRRPRQHLRPHLRRDHDSCQPPHRHAQVRSHRYRHRPARTGIPQRSHHVRRRPARRNSHHHISRRQHLPAQIPLPIPLRILRPFHRSRNRPPPPRNQRLYQLRRSPKCRRALRSVQHSHSPARSRPHINQPPALSN